LTFFSVALKKTVRLFKNRAVCAILAQNFLFGSVYYSILYYVPLALQNVRGLSPLASAGVIAAMVGAQSFTSVASGQYISRTGRYGEVLWFGYGVWTVGAALCCMFSRSLPIWAMAILLFVEGIGVGNCFQPSEYFNFTLPVASLLRCFTTTTTTTTTTSIASQPFSSLLYFDGVRASITNPSKEISVYHVIPSVIKHESSILLEQGGISITIR
jgi:MFS family permease